VKSLFKLPDSLEETERDKLIELLHENLDLFVTDDNPELGFTRVVEHKILLKPDVVGKHRLPPFKREILRDHLDNYRSRQRNGGFINFKSDSVSHETCIESGILTRVTRKTHLKESGRKINGRYKVRNNFAKRFSEFLQIRNCIFKFSGL
jgi:hypothetical protein